MAWWAALTKNTRPQKLIQVNTMNPPSRLEPDDGVDGAGELSTNWVPVALGIERERGGRRPSGTSSASTLPNGVVAAGVGGAAVGVEAHVVAGDRLRRT